MQEFHNITRAIPLNWIRLIYSPVSHPPATPQPCFLITNTSSTLSTIDFTHGKIHLFYQLLMNDQYPKIAALQVWMLNTSFQSPLLETYAPTPSLQHRILPTALSLY